ncbi:MAG: T9SS type A sorting domain-containing protein [Flavobacteriaceae bacterium]
MQTTLLVWTFTSYAPCNYHITIFDMYSNVYYDGESSNIEKTIDTANIPTGNYFLHIYIDGELTTYQLIIKSLMLKKCLYNL